MKQSEIWLINLVPTVGAEIKKTRPAIIVNKDFLGKLPLKIKVPITDWKNHYAEAPWMIKIEPDKTNKLIKPSCADCFQVRSLSQERFLKKVGFLNQLQLDKIQFGLAQILSIKI